ncbi:restriction endonuclease subunit S [Ruminococcus sp. 25CYCFAH16]
MDTKALRQKILDLAIRGKLVPQDPNDEPASVLLERIRAEKQQMVKDGKLKAKDIKNDTVIFKGEDSLHYEKFPDGTVKCIEDAIPFELPEGWEWVRLQSICEPITDGTHKTPQYSENGYVFLSSKNVTSGKIDWDNVMYIPEDLHNELYSRLSPQKNDILLAKNGTTGVAAIVDRDCVFDIYVSLALLRIVKYVISPEYLLSVIASSTIQDYFSSSLKGIGVPNLHLEHIRTSLIPVSPLHEKHRIVEKLNELLSFVDTIESDKTDLQTIIQQTKSKILDLAIRGKLVPQDPNDEPASVLLERIKAEKEELIKQGKIKRDKRESVIFKGEDNSYYEKVGSEVRCIDEELPFEIPDNWEWARLQTVCMPITDGTHKTPTYSEEGYTFLSSKNVVNGVIDWENVMHIPENLHNELYSRLSPQKNDILLAKNGTTGVAAIVDRDCVFDIYVTLALIRTVTHDISPHYLLRIIQSPVTQDYFKGSLKGIGVPNLHLEQIRTALIPICPFSEQQRITAKIKALFDMLDGIENALIE